MADFKNNATRLLESRKISYTLHSLNTTEKLSAEEVAGLLGVPEELVFKTLVVVPARKSNPLLILIPAGRELDIKSLRASIGEKDLRMATQVEAERMTGLQVGGISPLVLLHRGFRICIDSIALQSPAIYISAGQRGYQLSLAPAELIRLTDAKRLDDVSRSRST